MKANELLCRWGMPGRLMDLNTVERVLFSLLSDSVAAIAAGSSTFVASELRGLHQLFSAKPSRPHGNEHHTKPARRRFTAALRAGGDSRERGRPSEEGPTVLLPPTSMAKTVVMDRQGPLSPRPYGQRPGFAAPGPPPRREIEVADRYGTCMNTMTGGASADEWEEVYAEEERSDRSDGVLVSDEIEEEPAEVQGHDGKEGEQVPESDFLLELLSRRASHKRKFRCPGPTMKFRDAGYLKAEGVHEQLGLAKPCIPPNVFWGDMCLQLAETVEEAAVEPGGGEERALLGSPMVSSNILEALTTHPLQGVVSGLPEISPGASRVSAALFAAGFMAMPGKPSCSLKRDPQTRELTISASSPSLAFIQEMLIVDEVWSLL